MSGRDFPTPWEHSGGPATANGEAWVWHYAPSNQSSYDSAPEQEDTRMFSCPTAVAAVVVKAVNCHEALLSALMRLTAQVEGRTTDDRVQRTSALDDARAAIAKTRGGK